MLEPQTPSNTTNLNFSKPEWAGLIAAGDIAAAASLLANSIVLFIHGFMLWYRPAVVARLSLRMIVLSCIFNIIYCAGQLAADGISSQAFSCRVLIYVLIVSDSMACMCLAMVGLNLVMIFVLRVSRSVKLEIIYYLIIAVCGVLVAVVPISVNRRLRPNPNATCWYHYYFEGRLNGLFNWLWYYCWLMFSSVFAAFCAVISLAFVLQKQGNLTGTLDMFSFRDKDQYSKIQKLKHYSKNNTDVFKKIAKRCVLYPLVPLISKSWGIAIVITAACKGTVPYAIFVIDRIFGCLLGLMVSCIYYTDPALIAVFKEGLENLKKRYVYDYFSVKYQPSADPTVKTKRQYPERVKIIEVSNIDASSPLGISFGFDPAISHEENVGPSNRLTTSEGISTSDGTSRIDPHYNSSTNFPPHIKDPRRPSVSFKVDVPSVEVCKPLDGSPKDKTHTPQRRFSVLSVTSIHGKTYAPNEKIDNTKRPRMDSYGTSDRNKIQTIPMHRIGDARNTDNERRAIITNSQTYPDNGSIMTIVPYKYPCGAQFLHWVLVTVFRVSPSKRRNSIEEEDAPAARVFRDFTDNSNPTSPQISSACTVNTPTILPASLNLSDADQKLISGSSTQKHTKNISGGSKSPPPRAFSSDLIRDGEDDCDESYKEFPLRKASTINLGSMYRNKEAVSHLPPKEGSVGKHSRSSSSTSFSAFGLAKIFNRDKAIINSLGMVPRISKKILAPTSPRSSGITSASNDNSILMKNTANDGNTNQVRPAEDTRRHTFTSDNRATAIVEKPESIHSNVSIACPFPAELSPRPITKKTDPNLNDTLINLKHRSICSSTTKRSNPESISHVYQRLSIFGEDPVSFKTSDEKSPNISRDMSSSSITQTDLAKEADLKMEKRISMGSQLSTLDDYEKRLSLVSVQEVTGDHDGLSQGFTTINFISNWQDHDSDDSTRIMVHSEVWDIEEQFRAQIALSEAMERV